MSPARFAEIPLFVNLDETIASLYGFSKSIEETSALLASLPRCQAVVGRRWLFWSKRCGLVFCDEHVGTR